MAVKQDRFWEDISFAAMTPDQWESLCDGCARCCVHKFTDSEEGAVHYTNMACLYLDIDACRCTCYQDRHEKVPECLQLSPDIIAALYWLPSSCAYRLLSEGKPLPAWHPLITGDPDSTREAGMSVRGHVISERDAPEMAGYLTVQQECLPTTNDDGGP